MLSSPIYNRAERTQSRYELLITFQKSRKKMNSKKEIAFCVNFCDFDIFMFIGYSSINNFYSVIYYNYVTITVLY